MPGYPRALPSAAGVEMGRLLLAQYRWQREMFHRLVAMNSAKLASRRSRYAEVRLCRVSAPGKYGTQSCCPLPPAEKHLSAPS